MHISLNKINRNLLYIRFLYIFIKMIEKWSGSDTEMCIDMMPTSISSWWYHIFTLVPCTCIASTTHTIFLLSFNLSSISVWLSTLTWSLFNLKTLVVFVLFLFCMYLRVWLVNCNGAQNGIHIMHVYPSPWYDNN